jgi:cell division protein FtsQ
MQRLMLTPGFLLMLRVGLPMIAAIAGGTYYFSDPDRRALIRDTVAEVRRDFENRPEFMVHLMAVDGAEDALVTEIRQIVPISFPTSSFDLDLTEIRNRIAELPPVKAATVRIRPGGVLQVEVEPRVPVAIWRTAEGLSMVDVTGAHLAALPNRMARPDLPLIAGAGAALHVAEVLEIYRAAAPLGLRLRGIVRMGERRWDVVLDRGQRILLPEKGAVEALERVIMLDGAQDILNRDVSRIDLRLGPRPTVQMSQYASDVWWDIQKVSGQ